MKSFLNILSLILLGSFLAVAAYGAQSFRGLANFSAYSFSGQVKGIAFHQDSIKIKLKNTNPNAAVITEIVQLCNIDKYSSDNLHNNSQVRLLEKAIETGQEVRISYSDGFSKCINQISFGSVKFKGI